LGSRNPINVVNATMECLRSLSEPADTAQSRGKESNELDLPKQYYKNKAEGEANA